MQSLMDEMEACIQLQAEDKETRILAFPETWHSDLDRDEEVALSGFGCPLRLLISPANSVEEARAST